MIKGKFKNKYTTILLMAMVFLVSGIVVVKNRQDKTNNKVVENVNTEPKMALKSGYEIQEIDSEWDLLVANDFGVTIEFPKGSTIQKGGGFSKSHPEDETSQLGISIAGPVNAVVVIDVGFTNSRTSLDIINKFINTPGPAGFKYAKPMEKTINNAHGYEVYATGSNGTHKYHFVTINGDKYISLWYYYPWSGRNLTGREESVVKKVVSSFKLLQK